MAPKHCFTLFLMASGIGSAAAADQLPAYCGPVGVARYQMQGPPAAPPEPVITLQNGTVITVTNNTDVVNGDVSSPARLTAWPGPDGISLREAILATNNSPGTYTIRFDPKLAGATITIGPKALPDLTGGNVIIDGDIDGDGKPHVTLMGQPPAGGLLFGFSIKSGGNTIHALELDGFTQGVFFAALTPGQVLANNTVSHMTIRNATDGILLRPGDQKVPLLTRWVNTLIVGNDIQCSNDGIGFYLHFSGGNSLEHTTIIRNIVRGGNNAGISLQAGDWATGTDNTVTDAEIADNVVDGPWQAGIWLAAGAVGASRNHLSGIRVERNQVIMEPGSTTLFGMQIIVGDAGTDWWDPTFLPYTYPDDNEIANVQILGNTVSGAAARGINLQLGWGGAGNNLIHDIVVAGNTVQCASQGSIDSMGIRLLGGEGVSPAGRKPAHDNLMRNVVLEANTVRMSATVLYRQNGAITLTGGNTGAVNGRMENIWVSHNDLDGGGAVDLNIYGGSDHTAFTNPSQDFVSGGNTVSHVEVWCSLARTAPTSGGSTPSSFKGITVSGGINGATSNVVQGVRLQDNLVAGVLNDVTVQDNSPDGSTGNTASLLSVAAGTPDANPAGLRNAASVANVPLAAGSLASLYGSGFGSFTGSTGTPPLPTAVGGVSVQVNGVSAPLYYVSPSQLIFQVPWEVAGSLVSYVAATVGGVTSLTQPLSLAVADPGLYTWNGGGGGQAWAIDARTGRVPAAIWCPFCTPAARGDSVVLFATGLGAANPQPATGAGAAAGSVSVLAPTVTVGGVLATVSFSALIPGTAGLYEVVVQIPAAAPTGDAVPVTLSAAGVSSNTVTIAVQ